MLFYKHKKNGSLDNCKKMQLLFLNICNVLSSNRAKLTSARTRIGIIEQTLIKFLTDGNVDYYMLVYDYSTLRRNRGTPFFTRF